MAIRLRQAAAWLGALVGVTVAALLAGCAPQSPTGVPLVRALVESAAPPGAVAASPPIEVALPDDWARTRPGLAGPVRYRVSLPADSATIAGPPQALYVEQACGRLTVRLNGQVLHRDPVAGPVSQWCDESRLVPLPAALLRPADNALELTLDGLPLARTSSRDRAAALSALQVAPLDALARQHRAHRAWAETVPRSLAAAAAVVGAYLLVLAAVAPRARPLAWIGALSVVWAVVQTQPWRHLPGVDDSVAEFLAAALTPALTLAAVEFLLGSSRARIAWASRVLWLQCLLMPVTLLLASPDRLRLLTLSWVAVFALQIVLAGALCLRAMASRRDGLGPWLAMSLGVTALCAIVEVAHQALGLRVPAAQWAGLAMPLVLGLLGLRLVQQHGRETMMVEASQARLEQRIRDATAEIERNFRQLSELRVEQVTEHERKRIAADLHDDLGAKLLTIVHTSESERISTLAREALEEMRLSVRGLTGKPMRLVDALGDWRVEVMLRLNQAGIECEWHSPEGDELPQRLSARAYVQTTRILREATSNIIKHSGASRCIVGCAVAEGDFQLVIQDNGRGIAADVELRLDRGHGLASMKSRAKQLQGQCLVESAPGYGTVIRLTLPMEHATTAP